MFIDHYNNSADLTKYVFFSVCLVCKTYDQEAFFIRRLRFPLQCISQLGARTPSVLGQPIYSFSVIFLDIYIYSGKMF